MAMQLSKDSRLVRYAYLGDQPKIWPGESYHTSLCALFWRCVGTTLKVLFCAVVVSGFLGSLAVFAWREPWSALKVAGGAVFACVGAVGITMLGDRIRRAKSRPPSPTLEMLKSVKSRVCPLVEIR